MTKADLLAGAERVGIEPGKATALWDEIESQERRNGAASFNGANVAYYFGGAVIICAMTFFMVQVWSNSWEIVALALFYMALLGAIGWWLYHGADTRRPGGILVTAAVTLTPLLVYGIIRAFGLWSKADDPGSYAAFYDVINKSWVPMEIATIAVGLIVLHYVRFPFVTLPIAFALWFLSMDVTGLLTHSTGWDGGSYTVRQYVSIVFGIDMLAVAMLIDRRTEEDYAFWLYLYGTAAFAFGITILWDENQVHLACFAAISLAMIVVSILLGRRVLTVFGALGLFSYLNQLAYEYFKTSSGIFVLALTLIGLATIAAGIAYQRNERVIRANLVALCPKWMINALPISRAA